MEEIDPFFSVIFFNLVSKCISQAKQKMRRNTGRLIGVLQKGE